MRLYLVQHGEAASKDVDPKRPLTQKGKQDVTKTANFLRASGSHIDVIWHSTKTRAIETAGIIAKAVSLCKGTEEKEGLAPNDPVKDTFDNIMAGDSDVMIVGHLPFLQRLASLALMDSESQAIVGFRQGGVVCLERGDMGNWQLIFAVSPEFL